MSTFYSVGARYKVDDNNQTASRGATIKGQYRTYRVKSGDRIDTIAHQAFGDANRWWEIADLNPQIKFPLDLVPGDVLRIPL
jgi:nucleoid-associated protein YgaU